MRAKKWPSIRACPTKFLERSIRGRRARATCRARRRWSFAPATTRVGPTAPLALVASVVVRALPVLFPRRILCQLWPVKRYGLVHCAGTVCDLSRGHVGGIPSASLAGAWAPFNATFMPSIDVATVCIMQHGTSSTVVSNLIVRQLVGTPRTCLHSLPPAFAYRHCLRAAAHAQSHPTHASNATHLPPVARTPAAWRGTADVLGRRRVRTDECGRASAARALSGRSGCPRRLGFAPVGSKLN
jgi:hypothetical protein